MTTKDSTDTLTAFVIVLLVVFSASVITVGFLSGIRCGLVCIAVLSFWFARAATRVLKDRADAIRKKERAA